LTPKGAARKLKSLHNMPERKIFGVSDTLGNVLIYNNIGGDTPSLLSSVSIGGKAEVRGLCSNPYGNYLIGGAKDGSVTVFDLGVPGREKVARKLL
jgi:hypothetical protein